jgi:hypothetical protein
MAAMTWVVVRLLRSSRHTPCVWSSPAETGVKDFPPGAVSTGMKPLAANLIHLGLMIAALGIGRMRESHIERIYREAVERSTTGQLAGVSTGAIRPAWDHSPKPSIMESELVKLRAQRHDARDQFFIAGAIIFLLGLVSHGLLTWEQRSPWLKRSERIPRSDGITPLEPQQKLGK